MQNGGFLGLLAALGIPIISLLIGNLIGKGLQVRTRTSIGSGLQIERSKIRECRKPLYGDGLQIERSRGKGLKKAKISRLSYF